MRRHRRCTVRRACCCLTLQQGALCIAALQLTVGLLSLLAEVLYLAGVLMAGAYALDDDLIGNLPEDENRWGSLDIAYASLSGFLLFTELISLLFASLLLHGARTRRPGFVRAWVLFQGIMLFLGVASWSARLTLEFMFYPSRGAVLIIRALLMLCVPAYFWIVVRSFYCEIIDEREAAERGVVIRPLRYNGGPPNQPPPPYQVSPPYLPSHSWDGTEGRLLETNLDDLEDGFGTHWQYTSKNEQYQQEAEAGPLPSKESLAATDDSVVLRRSQRTSSAGEDEVDEGDYDDVATDEDMEAELEAARKRASRRIAGAGRMVLPPLPPGARASLQHVPPPVTPPLPFPQALSTPASQALPFSYHSQPALGLSSQPTIV